MSSRAKLVSLIILTQIGCVAIGLWMQHRYVIAAIVAAEETEARTALDGTLRAAAAAILGEGSTPEDVNSWTVADVRQAWDDGNTGDTRPIVLVDADWRVLAYWPSSALSVTAGERVVWKPRPGRDRPGDTGMTGSVVLEDREYLAVAYPVQHNRGRILAVEPMDGVRQRVAAATESLPLTSLMAALWTCALLSITAFLIMARLHDQIDRDRAAADSTALQQIRTLVRTRDSVIFGLAKLADSRDPETGEHLERIAVYSSTLASALRSHPKFGRVVTPNFVRLIGISSALHDIGKVGIADHILLKPGRLTDEERTEMQKHSMIGGECLRKIEERLGSSNFLQMAREIALAHHERWDGGGYPNGLKGEDIPLAARIVSIADVYDAIKSKRVYKSAMPHSECVEQIRQGAGTQFDPELVKVWLTLADQFQDLARRYSSADTYQSSADSTPVGSSEPSAALVETLGTTTQG